MALYQNSVKTLSVLFGCVCARMRKGLCFAFHVRVGIYTCHECVTGAVSTPMETLFHYTQLVRSTISSQVFCQSALTWPQETLIIPVCY